MAEFYQGMVDAANSGNKEAIQESTSRETYENHVTTSFVDKYNRVMSRIPCGELSVAPDVNRWPSWLQNIDTGLTRYFGRNFFNLGPGDWAKAMEGDRMILMSDNGEAFSNTDKHLDYAVFTLSFALSVFNLARTAVVNIRAEAAGNVGTPQITLNRLAGKAAEQSFADAATANGFEIIGSQGMGFKTPFGTRFVDFVLKNPTTGSIGGVELKSSLGAFKRFDMAARQQFAADWWINTFGAQGVGKAEGLFLDNTIKMLWK